MVTDTVFAYEPIDFDVVPKDDKQISRINLFVFLPTPRKYILFISIGDEITPARLEALKRHVVPTLYARSLELEAALGGTTLPDTSLPRDSSQILGQTTNKILNDIYVGLLDEANMPPTAALEKLSILSEQILDAIAPDIQSVKKKFLENIQYVWIMNDSAALTSIAIMFAAANGIDSRKSLRDIVDACLVMDLPLSKIGKDISEKIVLDPNSATPEELLRYQEHPRIAFNIAKKTLKHYSEAAIELILCHHEQRNGKGFPSKIQNGTLFLPAQVLSAAVEAFEFLKRAAAAPRSNASENVFLNIVRKMKEIKVEPHKRRHSAELLEKVEVYLEEKSVR